MSRFSISNKTCVLTPDNAMIRLCRLALTGNKESAKHENLTKRKFLTGNKDKTQGKKSRLETRQQ